MDENAFRRLLASRGYTETKEFFMEPDAFKDTHTHERDVCALVLDGEISLTTEAGDRTHRVGDTCTLAAHDPHAEKAGPEGVRLLVGLKPAEA